VQQKREKTIRPSLRKSTFWRLVVITFAAVLVFYIMGLSINQIGIRNVRNDMEAALQAHTEYAASQLEEELNRLKFFMLELLQDKQLLRFSIAYPTLSDWERLSYVKGISSWEYLVKRSSDLIDSVQVMLPQWGKAILTDQTQYADLDRNQWERLYAGTERGKVSFREMDGSLWMLLPRFDGGEPLFMIAVSISRENLNARLERLGNDQTGDLALCWENGEILAWAGRGKERLQAGNEGDWKQLSASAPLPSAALTLYGHTAIDEKLEPFTHYRRILWGLTLAALGLLGAYILYCRRFIFRPMNDLFESMRRVERDRGYRIETSRPSDYDDLYVQFNDMVDHIEKLAGQVYEEQYRAQKAELKQLQMQIDPHFLYNSLYLIYRIAQSENQPTIAKLSQNLSNYYRYITKMPEQVVPLREEIGHVMNYLEIQRIRFEPRIHIEAEPLPEEIAEESIPSLIIQPIVENAFQHGVKELTHDGLITLKYRVDPDSFRVTVADNSGKMTPEKVEELWNHLNDPETEDSSALRNLYRRLQLYEGQDQVMKLESVNNGLSASVIFRRKGTNDENAADRG